MNPSTRKKPLRDHETFVMIFLKNVVFSVHFRIVLCYKTFLNTGLLLIMRWQPVVQHVCKPGICEKVSFHLGNFHTLDNVLNILYFELLSLKTN